VISGISKRPNVKALLQCAAAFGVRQVIVVGQEHNLSKSSLPTTLQRLLPAEMRYYGDDVGDGDDHRHQEEESPPEEAPMSCLDLVRFRKWRDVVAYLKERNVPLVGVEIHPTARPILELLEEHTQRAKTFDEDGNLGITTPSLAFVVGNEGDGLSAAQMEACRHFVRIPQYGTGTASLNVAVAASIVLHRCHSYRRSILFEEEVEEEGAASSNTSTEGGSLTESSMTNGSHQCKPTF
jgi:tRNA(Leu) C34 or U34 (ribose-2'-O)-methylase TrmL